MAFDLPAEVIDSLACIQETIAAGGVKIGGYVVGYTPSANQLQQFCNAAPRDFLQEDACELILREWKVRGLVVRPSTADFGHTAFLSFFRRISG